MIKKQIALLGIFCLTFVFSCKKESPEQSCGTCDVGGSQEPDGFTFTKNGGGATTADSAYFVSASNTIVAYYQGNNQRVIIKTSSLAAGTYTISTLNKVTYYESTGVYTATGGHVNITSNANSKMSGSFITNGTGGGFIGVNGQFKNIPKR